MPRGATKRTAEGGEEVDTKAPLVGESLEVPSWVFPRDKLPRGKKGWAATVTGVSKEDSQRVFVHISGSPDEFFFPLEEVQKWVIPREPASPAHSALQTRSRYSLRSASKQPRPDTTEDAGTAAVASPPQSEAKRKRGRPRKLVLEEAAPESGEPLSQSAEVVPQTGPEAVSSEGTSSDEGADREKRPRPSAQETWPQTLLGLAAEAAKGVAGSLAAYAVAVAIQKEWQF